MFIIGKGNSAFETADNLTEHAAVIHVAGPRSINFAWRTHFIGHLRAVNNNFLDTYQLKTQNMVLDGDILRIERRADDYLITFAYARRDKVVQLAYDRVIACTGFRMDSSIFDADCRPELTINDRFPALTAEWESVNVPGLYFAGTLTQSRDFKKHTSAFIHGFRYGIRALVRMLDEKYHGIEWPHRTVPRDGLADAVLARINRTSALFQQFGFLCDVVHSGRALLRGDAAGLRPVRRLLHDQPRVRRGPRRDRSVRRGGGPAVGGRQVARRPLPAPGDPPAREPSGGRHPPAARGHLQRLDRREALPHAVARLHRGAQLVTVGRGTDLVNLRDFEAAARARLDPVHYDYFASGAQDEITVAANEAAFRGRT